MTIADFQCKLRYGWIGLFGLLAWLDSSQAQDPLDRHTAGNRLTYLDEPCDPYYVGQSFPKLITPQWVGEQGVEAVVTLAIDDMRDPAHYEAYLRPILDRLKEIDGRAAVSIMTNQVDPNDEQVSRWIREGVTIDVHTIDHPCPCLQDSNFEQSSITTVSISCSKSQTIAPPHSECRVAIRSTHQVRDFGLRFSIARRQTGISFTGTVLFFRSSHQMTRSCQRIHFEMRMGDSDSTSTSPSPLSPIRFEIIPTPM